MTFRIRTISLPMRNLTPDHDSLDGAPVSLPIEAALQQTIENDDEAVAVLGYALAVQNEKLAVLTGLRSVLGM